MSAHSKCKVFLSHSKMYLPYNYLQQDGAETPFAKCISGNLFWFIRVAWNQGQRVTFFFSFLFLDFSVLKQNSPESWNNIPCFSWCCAEGVPGLFLRLLHIECSGLHIYTIATISLHFNNNFFPFSRFIILTTRTKVFLKQLKTPSFFYPSCSQNMCCEFISQSVCSCLWCRKVWNIRFVEN